MLVRLSSPRTVFFVFFFFQAEDGIRDWSVTGVQTCALPISAPAGHLERDRGGTGRPAGPDAGAPAGAGGPTEYGHDLAAEGSDRWGGCGAAVCAVRHAPGATWTSDAPVAHWWGPGAPVAAGLRRLSTVRAGAFPPWMRNSGCCPAC